MYLLSTKWRLITLKSRRGGGGVAPSTPTSHRCSGGSTHSLSNGWRLPCKVLSALLGASSCLVSDWDRDGMGLEPPTIWSLYTWLYLLKCSFAAILCGTYLKVHFVHQCIRFGSGSQYYASIPPSIYIMKGLMGLILFNIPTVCACLKFTPF